MSGKRKSVKIPVLIEGEYQAITNKEKAELIGKKFASVHSGSHLDEIHKQRKKDILRTNSEVTKKKDSDDSALDMDLSLHELKMALEGSGYTAPGQDRLCYAMFRQLPKEVLEIILKLFNKIWREGVMPDSWKSALILPFGKSGKDLTNAGNYRPIALTSHLCKWMEKIIVCRLTYYLEQRGLLNKYQSGFRKGRSTVDALVKVSNEAEKAISMKEIMAIVYFDIEKLMIQCGEKDY